jgi:hypothetical protein
VGDDVEVITGISERLFACLIASSVARYACCLTNAGL